MRVRSLHAPVIRAPASRDLPVGRVDPDSLGEVRTCISGCPFQPGWNRWGTSGDRNATRGGHIALLILRAWIPRILQARAQTSSPI